MTTTPLTMAEYEEAGGGGDTICQCGYLRAGLDATSHIAGDHDTINSADLKLRSIIDDFSKGEYIPK